MPRLLLTAAIALLIGFLLGRLTARTPPRPVASVAPPAPVLQVPAARPAAPESTPDAAENAVLRKLNTDLEVAANGIPLRWREGGPDVAAAEFGDTIRAAIAACHLDADLVQVDCSEPPCLAVFRDAEPGLTRSLTRECRTWTEKYGPGGGTTVIYSAPCPDGTKERVTIIGPSTPGELVPEGAPANNSSLRNEVRKQAIQDGWTCAPVSP